MVVSLNLRILSPQQFGLFLATAAISTAAPLFRQLIDISPLLAASLRLLAAAVILLLIGGYRINQLTSPQFKGALVCGVFYAIHFGAWVTSLHYTTIAASVTLVTTTPIMLLCLSMIRGDAIIKTQIAACIVASLGVCLIAGADWNTSPTALWGDLLALVGAVAMAGYFLVVKPLGELPLRPFMFVTAIVGGSVLMLVYFEQNTNQTTNLTTEHIYWLLALALGPHLIGHGLLTWSLRRTSSTAVALATVGEPAGSALLAYALFSETIDGWTAFGCALTLGAIFIGTQTKAPQLKESAST
jgi:drug/metabolite transporter (DMT)-like permease